MAPVYNRVEVGIARDRFAQEELRFVVVHSSQLAQQQAQALYRRASKEAEAVTAHIKQVQARWFACEADVAAIAEYAGRGPGRRAPYAPMAVSCGPLSSSVARDAPYAPPPSRPSSEDGPTPQLSQGIALWSR